MARVALRSSYHHISFLQHAVLNGLNGSLVETLASVITIQKGGHMRRITTMLVVFMVVWLMWLGAFNFGFADQAHQPAIDKQEVTRIIQTQFPNARILEMKLDSEDGKLVYEVELVTQERQKKELHVNAESGKIEKLEND